MLGIRTLAEAQATIDADMFAWWQAYLTYEPQTLHRLWMGTLTAAAINTSMRYTGPTLTADDVFPPPVAEDRDAEADAEALAERFFGDLDKKATDRSR